MSKVQAQMESEKAKTIKLPKMQEVLMNDKTLLAISFTLLLASIYLIIRGGWYAILGYFVFINSMISIPWTVYRMKQVKAVKRIEQTLIEHSKEHSKNG